MFANSDHHEVTKRFSALALSDNRLSSSPASPGYFPELSRVERGLIRDTVHKLRQAVTEKDRIGYPGLVYVAKQKGTRFTKVGYSKHKDASRIGRISATCDLEFEKMYQIPILRYGAYRAEQILHKALRQWAYDVLNCKCRKEHREWYDRPFDFVITLANLVHTWMRQKPYSTQNWKLKPDWDEALDVWISSQDTRTPMAWSEFFLMGLLLKPVPAAFPGSPFWKGRKSASVINVGYNGTPSARPKGPVHADSSPASLRSDRTLDDSPFRDVDSVPRRPSILRAERTPSKLTSRRAVDESLPETPVKHVSSLNPGSNKKRERFLGLREAMPSKGDKGFSRDLTNTNDGPAITTEVAVAKEDQGAEEDSAAEEDLTAEDDSAAEEDSTAEEDLTAEDDSAAEEDLTAEDDSAAEEDSTAQKDSTAEEDSAAEEDPTVEEDSEEYSTAEDDQAVEEDLTKQDASFARNDSTSEGSVDDRVSSDDEGSDFQYASTTDENSESDIERTEEELARERQELAHEVRELLAEAEELEDPGRDDIMARLEETPTVDEIVVAREGPSTDGAKEPSFPDSPLDVRFKVLHQDSEADPEVAPEDEPQSGLENEPPADVFIREKRPKVLPIERPAVDEDAAEERNELEEDELGRIASPTVQVKRSRLGRSDGGQEEASASPKGHVLTSQDLAENGKSSVSPAGKAPPKSVDEDKQNSYDKWEGFKCESNLDFSTINSAKSPHSAQQLEATATTSSEKARDLFALNPVQEPAVKEGCEVILQNTYTVHPGAATSEPLRFCCHSCCHFDGNIISPDKEEILRSGGEISPPQCMVCGSECQLFRYLSQETDPDVQRIESAAPSEKDHGSLRAFQEGPFEADPHNEQNQSTDLDTGVGGNAATLPRSTGLQPSSPECTSMEKPAMVTEQTSPRITEELPPHPPGQAPAGIQMTGFEKSHWNNTNWTDVFGGAQAEPRTSFPAREATKGHESGDDHKDKG
jgi:hypothetical protein